MPEIRGLVLPLIEVKSHSVAVLVENNEIELKESQWWGVVCGRGMRVGVKKKKISKQREGARKVRKQGSPLSEQQCL